MNAPPPPPLASLTDRLRRIEVAARGTADRRHAGRLLAVTGTIVRAELPGAEIGELCELRDPRTGATRMAEVVGLDGAEVLLAPYGSSAGLSLRTEVAGLGIAPSIEVGDHLLGAVIDANGRPMLGRGLDPVPGRCERRPVDYDPPNPMARAPVDDILTFGVRVLDGMMPCGVGQRIGVFGPAGAGKSTLMSAIVANAAVDVVVVALVGERGREVGDFVNSHLPPAIRARCITVVATSDRPSVERMRAAMVATTIAEHYRDRGLRVLLVVDSVTRLARALREIGLAAGEPPTRRGFPPSVFATLPRLFERAGTGPRGSITAIYTVLLEGEASSDPVAEETRSLLDGHVMLSDKIAAAGRYPAVDVLESKSRLFEAIATPAHRASAAKVRGLMAKHKDLELLIQVGEYRPGQDPAADEAVRKYPAIDAFLRQPTAENAPLAATIARLAELAG